MVHILYNGRPICTRGIMRCEFSTRREAFDQLLKLLNGVNDPKYTIEKGPCPNSGDTK